MKRWFCAIGLALSLGCATAVVRPYVGEQQAWPTASGSIVSTKYALPVFTSLPPTPYEVIAEMRISSPFYAQPEEGHMPRLVKRAEEIGADALVFVQGSVFFSTSYGPRGGNADDTSGKTPTLTTVNTFNPESFVPGVTILAIRWTDEPPPGLPSHKKPAAAAAAATPEAVPTPAASDTNAAAPSIPPVVTDTNAAPQPTAAPAPAASDTNAAPAPAAAPAPVQPVTPAPAPPANPTTP